MSAEEAPRLASFEIRAADTLAAEVAVLVQNGTLDARCPAADAVLDYASIRFGSHDPMGTLLELVKKNRHPDT